MKRAIWLAALTALFLWSAPAMAQVADRLAVRALGGQSFNCRSSDNERCYDFYRANHRLRLEDVNIHRTADGSGYSGTFTITNRLRNRPDVHVFVSFAVASGVVKYERYRTDGSETWYELFPSREANDVIGHVFRIGTSGNAQISMGNAIWSIIELYRRRSMSDTREPRKQRRTIIRVPGRRGQPD